VVNLVLINTGELREADKEAKLLAVKPAGFRIRFNATGLAGHLSEEVYSFRRGIEQDCYTLHGEISRVAAKRIFTACCALAEVLIARDRREQAAQGEIELSAEDARWLSDSIGRNNERCDKALAAMGLEPRREPLSKWDCPRCRRFMAQCICPKEIDAVPTNGTPMSAASQPVAEDDASRAIPPPSDGSTAESVDRKPEGQSGPE
jgi:hypothetical protein